MFFGHVHGADKCAGKFFREDGRNFVAVNVIGEEEPLKERNHSRRKIHEVNRRTKNNCVGGFNFFLDGREVIFHGAGAVRTIFEFAGETTRATFEVQRVKINHFGRRAEIFRAFHGVFEKFGGVPIFSGTSVDGD